MGKRIRKVLVKRPARTRRKLIILGTEGKNKTETLYFSQLEKRQQDYHFIFASSNNTDPIGIITSTVKEAKKQGINIKDGDFAAAVFDIDLDDRKAVGIEKLAEQKKVNLYTSNPCFELWYLLHFTYSTKAFYSSDEVIRELRKYIPGYEKGSDYYAILDPLSTNAVVNARRLKETVKENSRNSESSIIDNPNTDVFLLVENVLFGSK